MAEGWLRWLLRAWRTIDRGFEAFFGTLKRILWTLNVLRVLTVILVVLVVAAAVLVFVFPQWTPYFVAALLLLYLFPLLLVFLLLSLPFRAKSLVRLVRMGYPANAKELTIRIAARKLHEESIETERLLLETAWQESQKLVKKYRERAETLKRHLDEMDREPDRR